MLTSSIKSLIIFYSYRLPE